MLPVEITIGSWSPPVFLSLSVVLVELVYLRGWFYIRQVSLHIIPSWRAVSFVTGVGLFWAAVGSPLAAFDEEFLTVHMFQHLLLMSIAPPLILMGAPVMPLLHGLPRRFVRSFLGPLFRWTPLQRAGRVLSQLMFCWFAATTALIGWHLPAAFTLGLQSEGWHVVEHVCFVTAGFLFWWPVVQPWPSISVRPSWSILLYLFLATLPCDILSGFLVFCDRVVYPVYFSVHRHFAVSVLEDQQCAGALMWTCITIIYLVPAASLTVRLLGAGNAHANDLPQSKSILVAARSSNPQSVEAR
jgi:putative membrane protein